MPIVRFGYLFAKSNTSIFRGTSAPFFCSFHSPVGKCTTYVLYIVRGDGNDIPLPTDNRAKGGKRMNLTDKQKEEMSVQERVALARRQLEQAYPPDVVKRIRKGSRAVARRMMAVIGYCKLCNAEIHYFDKRAGTGDLCLDCFIQEQDKIWKLQQRVMKENSRQEDFCFSRLQRGRTRQTHMWGNSNG